MIVKVKRSFSKDVLKINEVRVLEKIRRLIQELENAASLSEVKNIKKIKGSKIYYRIRLGNFRLGFEFTYDNEIVLMRIIHRKDIYKHFP